jgi:hypothetical protein
LGRRWTSSPAPHLVSHEVDRRIFCDRQDGLVTDPCSLLEDPQARREFGGLDRVGQGFVDARA